MRAYERKRWVIAEKGNQRAGVRKMREKERRKTQERKRTRERERENENRKEDEERTGRAGEEWR